MTKKKLERAVYVNESQKRRKEKTSKNRQSWAGIRPAIFESNKKYNRQKFKKELDIALNF